MEFSIIKMKKQAITKDIVEEALRICYDNISFSTFPYIVYGLNSSKKTLQQYNSGNCIALSLFLKTYFKNLGITSYLIPASVPKIHMVPGVNHICHVSLLIPYDKDKYFIVDPAFHFLEPLNCIESNNVEREIKTMNIHNDTFSTIKYLLTEPNEHNQFTKKQCTCLFTDKMDDPWYYYINEVKLEDADKYIGAVFMDKKPEPFIVKTVFDYETQTIKKLFHIKRMTPDTCVIIKNSKEVYTGNIKDIPIHLLNEIYTKLFKYFKRSIFT